MREGFRLRLALLNDLESILALERSSPEAPQWSEAVWRSILTGETTAPMRAVFVAEGCERIVGFVVASCLREVGELESVAVAETERRQGVGRALCSQALIWARGQGAEVTELEVRAGSAVAGALYRSLGFVEQRRRPHYYHDPVDDAVVMVLQLSR
ncbi:MAG TPA: GNAT family N-acetyltransferase [Acidobacteriaceae bacterium]